MGRLVLELVKDRLSGALFFFADINFLYMAILLFVVCSIVFIVVSLLTKEPSDEHLAGLTFATAAEGGTEDGIARSVSDPAWRTKDKILSWVVAVLVAAVMIYFTGP